MSKKPLFKLGQVVATVNALTFANQHQIDLLGLLQRHHTGDWGNLCSEDKEITQTKSSKKRPEKEVENEVHQA